MFTLFIIFHMSLLALPRQWRTTQPAQTHNTLTYIHLITITRYSSIAHPNQNIAYTRGAGKASSTQHGYKASGTLAKYYGNRRMKGDKETEEETGIQE